MPDMIRMSEIQNQKKQNKKEMMVVVVVTKAVLVGAAMMLGLAATVGWLSQEAQAAICLDCDNAAEDPGTGAEPVCPNGILSCPPWAGGHGVLECDPSICGGTITEPAPPLTP